MKRTVDAGAIILGCVARAVDDGAWGASGTKGMRGLGNQRFDPLFYLHICSFSFINDFLLGYWGLKGGINTEIGEEACQRHIQLQERIGYLKEGNCSM